MPLPTKQHARVFKGCLHNITAMVAACHPCCGNRQDCPGGQQHTPSRCTAASPAALPEITSRTNIELSAVLPRSRSQSTTSSRNSRRHMTELGKHSAGPDLAARHCGQLHSKGLHPEAPQSTCCNSSSIFHSLEPCLLLLKSSRCTVSSGQPDASCEKQRPASRLLRLNLLLL